MSVALQLLLAHIGRATSTEPDAAGVAQVRDLCHQCQAANPSDRPTFKQICQQLSKVETNTLASQMVKLMEEKKILHDILPEHVRPPLRIATPLPMCEEQTRGACGGRCHWLATPPPPRCGRPHPHGPPVRVSVGFGALFPSRRSQRV